MTTTCMHSSHSGSCTKPAVEGSLFCSSHSSELQRISTYVLEDSNLSEAFEAHSQGQLYTVKSELVLLRAMISDRLRMAQTDADKLSAYSQVGTWIATVDKLVTSLCKLEKDTASVITKETLMQVAKQFVGVISSEIKGLPGHENVIDAIAVKLVQIVSTTKNIEQV